MPCVLVPSGLTTVYHVYVFRSMLSLTQVFSGCWVEAIPTMTTATTNHVLNVLAMVRVGRVKEKVVEARADTNIVIV